jgi:hypothetical protein
MVREPRLTYAAKNRYDYDENDNNHNYYHHRHDN